MYDSLVIGAGQAGLAMGYYLQRCNKEFRILEASDQPGGSWPHYYDSLKLFSPARFSSMPGMRFPGDPDRYPLRDEVVAYLRDYAQRYALPVETGVRVAQITRAQSGFRVLTTEGREYLARTVVAATGAFHRPNLPALPGQAKFQGQTLHSSAYRAPDAFQGQRVVIVGARNSAVQIGYELSRVARVTLATQHPLRFIPQRIRGQDIHFWWWLGRIDNTVLGGEIALKLGWVKSGGVLDAGLYQAAYEAGQFDARPMFTEFTPSGVRWADGTAEAVDTVIFATGFRPNLDYLMTLGALDSRGEARHRHGVSRTTPGLYYMGLSGQRTFASATLRGVGPDAAYISRHLCGYLKQPALPPTVAQPIFTCCPALSEG